MKDYRKVSVLLLATLLVTTFWTSTAFANDSDDSDDSDSAGFAGTFLADFTPAGPPPFKALLTLGDDGTVVLTNSTQFGAPNMAVNGFNGTSHGAWSQSGDRGLESTVLFFDFDPDGTLTAIVRVRVDLDFDGDRDSFIGVFLGEVFTLAQDPLDPAEVPVASFSGTMNGRRVDP